MNTYKEIFDNKGNKITDVIAITQYMDGIVIGTKNGVYSNVNSLLPKEVTPEVQEVDVVRELKMVKDNVLKLKRKSDSSTYLYGQGQSLAYEEVLTLLAEAINRNKE